MKNIFLLIFLSFCIPSVSYSKTLTFEKCGIISMTPPPNFNVENHTFSKKNYSKTFEKNVFIADLKNKNIQQVQIFTDSFLQERNNSSSTFKFKKIITSNYFTIKYDDKDYINASGKEYIPSTSEYEPYSVVINKKNKKITHTTGNQIYEWQCE
jgi:hypothetical protein